MYKLPLKGSNHTWGKSNLVTITTGKKPYDEIYCEKCGIKGKRYNLAEAVINGRYSKDKVMSCPYAEAITTNDIPKRIKVADCKAYGSQFKNLTSGSEHDVVTPPSGYKNDHTGVWVMGIDEPVKMLAGEYTPI